MMQEKIVFTGTLISLTRKQAEALVFGIGAMAQQTITKDTAILVIGSSRPTLFEERVSLKRKKVDQLIKQGIPIRMMNEKEFLSHIHTEVLKRQLNL